MFEKWADANPVEQFKAMCCLLYQCCEGKVPNSRLYDEAPELIAAFRRPIGSDILAT